MILLKSININLKISISILCDLYIIRLAVDKNTNHQTNTPGSSKEQASGIL